MKKSLIVFILSNILFHSYGALPATIPSSHFSAIPFSEAMRKNGHDVESEITNLIQGSAPLTFSQRKVIFDLLNRLSGKDYINFLHETIDLFHENADLPESKIELVLFPNLLEMPDIVGNKDLFLIFNYKNKHVQSLKNKILGSEKISKLLKDKLASRLSYKEKSRAYDTVAFGQGLLPEILPSTQWAPSFLNNPASLRIQEETLSSLTLELRNIVALLSNNRHFTEDQIKQISSSARQMLLDLKNLMLYTPLPDLHETKYLEEKFYAETFPSIQKLKTVLFEIQQNKDDNQLTDIIGHHFFDIGNSCDSYFIEYVVCRELLKQQVEENSTSPRATK